MGICRRSEARLVSQGVTTYMAFDGLLTVWRCTVEVSLTCRLFANEAYKYCNPLPTFSADPTFTYM
jgi:hypothetical protein